MRTKEKEKENGSETETRTRSYAIAGTVTIAFALIAAMMVIPAAAWTSEPNPDGTTTFYVDPSETDSLYSIMQAAAPGDTVIFPAGYVYNPYINMGTTELNIPNMKWIGEGGAGNVTLDLPRP